MNIRIFRHGPTTTTDLGDMHRQISKDGYGVIAKAKQTIPTPSLGIYNEATRTLQTIKHLCVYECPLIQVDETYPKDEAVWAGFHHHGEASLATYKSTGHLDALAAWAHSTHKLLKSIFEDHGIGENDEVVIVNHAVSGVALGMELGDESLIDSPLLQVQLGHCDHILVERYRTKHSKTSYVPL